MIRLPVISDRAYYRHEKRLKSMRILAPLSLVVLFLLTLVTGQTAFFLLALPLFAYYGYISQSLAEKKRNSHKGEVLVLDENGAHLYQGKNLTWSASRDMIMSLDQENAFHPAPDILQQFIDELHGSPYESKIIISTEKETRQIRVNIRSFHEGHEVRLWFGKGFEKNRTHQMSTRVRDMVMSY